MKTKNFGDEIRQRLKKDPKLASAVAAETKRMDKLLSMKDNYVQILFHSKWTTVLCVDVGQNGIYIKLYDDVMPSFIPEKNIRPLPQDEELKLLFNEIVDKRSVLPAEDILLLCELLPELLTENKEKYFAAVKATKEILDDYSVPVEP